MDGHLPENMFKGLMDAINSVNKDSYKDMSFVVITTPQDANVIDEYIDWVHKGDFDDVDSIDHSVGVIKHDKLHITIIASRATHPGFWVLGCPYYKKGDI